MGKKKHRKQEKEHCALCDRRVLPSDKKNSVVGSTGKIVCSSCLSVSNHIINSFRQQPVYPENTSDKITTPAEIIKNLDRSIIGQEEAKKAIAVAMWKQTLRANQHLPIPKLNLLLYGPTGCGKTTIVQTAAELIGLPFLSFDASALTEAGYRGRDAADVIKDLVSAYKGTGDIQYAVVFLDEIDKLSASGNDARKEYHRGDQHSILKLVENAFYEIDSKWISTKNMLFIFGGAFSGLTFGHNKVNRKPIGFLPAGSTTDKSKEFCLSVEDFIHYGMEPELMGRIGQIVPVHPLTKQDLAQILLKSSRSAYLEYRRFFSYNNIELTLSQIEAEELAQIALDRGTGARGLNALIEQHMEPLLLRYSEGTLRGPVSVIGGVKNVPLPR